MFHTGYIEMMANELAVEQEENSFSTQHVIDPKPNKPMLILENKKSPKWETHVNLDHIRLHEEMSSIMNPVRKYVY